jgi:exodeoxyribonuclease VII large subunit
MPQSAPTNATEWTVSELAGALKRTLEDAFGHVRLRGEISGYRGPHSSGHAYFCLKDRDARLDAVVWRTTFGRLKFKPQEGLEVVATGRITTFPGKSTYQIVIDALEPAGIGALMALVEARRKALAAEGLFDAARKRPLPFLPKVIGVVTSPTGAVIRDILHRLEDRFPRQVLVWPARVQGETSAAEIVCGIKGFNALAVDGAIPRPDIIVVARGGGSLEDLWSFNEEAVVRAVAESAIPVVSAVGHETDWTLIDHAADLRAPTPTGAAEMVVPVRADLVLQVSALARRQGEGILRSLSLLRAELRSAARALPSPETLLAGQRQRLDLASARLAPALLGNARQHDRLLRGAAQRLGRCSPHLRLASLRGRLVAGRERLPGAAKRLIQEKAHRVEGLSARLAGGRGALIRAERTRIATAYEHLQRLREGSRRASQASIERWSGRLDGLGALLASLGYRAVLARGYALVRDERGRALSDAERVQAGQAMAIEFHDGTIRAVASGTRVRRRLAAEVQASLFDV